MLQIIRFIKGYLSIKVWGFSPERFMNLCGNRNIFLWNIKNHGDYYTMCVSLKGFYQLKSITRKTGTRVVITARYGLPFLSLKMKKRKVFLMGLLGSLSFWIWMSGFIWNVDIQGNLYVTDEVFLDFLSKSGIEAGMKKKEVDIEALEKSIRNEFGLVTWTSARIYGTRLMIQVKENDLVKSNPLQKEEEKGKDKETEGYDIIADKDGVIVSIVTRSGLPKVGEGDEVKKGDILVEGCIPIYHEDTTVKRYEYCRADADILIKYQKTVTESLHEKYEKRIYTGKEAKRSYLMLFYKRLALPFFQNQYTFFDKLESQKQLSILGGYRFPVYYGKTVVREYVKEEAVYSKEEIKSILQEKIQKFIQTLEEKGVQITEKNVTIGKYKGVWKMKLRFTATESAVREQKTAVRLLENEEE